MKLTARKIAYISILTAASLIMFVIENLMPPFLVPGAKLGLSNIFGLLTLILFGPLEALILVSIRTVLGAIFSGNFSTLIYSFTAGIIAMLTSIILYKTLFPKISIVSISVAAAVIHNVMQNLIFIAVSSTKQMLYYMPYLVIAGVLSGVVVGAAVWFSLKALPSVNINS
jgi:heptaprenyl diphosphate synthase